MRIKSTQALWAGCTIAQGAVAQHLDPISNYCFRFDHQFVKNDVLYIYMGIETFAEFPYGVTNHSNITVGYNEYVIHVDLPTLGLIGFNPGNMSLANASETAVSITADPSTGSLPPQVVQGTMYQGTQSDDRIYLYGGTTSYTNTSFPGWQSPTTSAYSLWSYNTTSTQWTAFDVGQNVPNRPNSGAAAEAVDQGLAFYFNGELDSGSSSETLLINDTHMFPSGMVVISTTDQTARNLSTAQISGDSARARGRMQYIPGVGAKGILVLIGGSSLPANQLDDTDYVDLVPMTEIGVFDVASIYNSSTPNGVWYTQNATNQNATNVPSPRVDFCLVSASAQDASSHNIYMYGGRDASNPPVRFSDVWVLSLPSFTWIPVSFDYPKRWAHTCHLVGNRTLLSVGGVVDIREMEGATNTQPQDLFLCDWATQGFTGYDISDLTWVQGWNLSTRAYEVPEPLISTIGGSRLGGATTKTPLSNFSQNGLAQLFDVDQDDIAKQPPHGDTTEAPPHGDTTEAPPQTANNEIAIIAGTVGGVVGLALVVLGWYAAWQWRKKPTHLQTPVHENDLHRIVHPELTEPVEMHSVHLQAPVHEKDGRRVVHPELTEYVELHSISMEERYEL